MIIAVSISSSRILHECKDQTSHDLQAMRSRGAEGTETIYDDWVITDDNYDDIYFPLQEAGADLYHGLRTLLRSFSSGKDIIRIEIDCARENAYSQEILESLVRQYFKFRLLGWWYTYRDADLANTYLTRANNVVNDIFGHCVPRTGTLQQRYF